MTMNQNAASEGKYSVYYFSQCPDSSNDTYNCSKCLFKISDYYGGVSIAILINSEYVLCYYSLMNLLIIGGYTAYVNLFICCK